MNKKPPHLKILIRATKGREIAEKLGKSHRPTAGLIAAKLYAKDALKWNEKRQMMFITNWRIQLAELMPGCKADNLNEIDKLISDYGKATVL